jgi:hypothetical protein
MNFHSKLRDAMRQYCLIAGVSPPRHLARFPARWNHLAEKESRQVNMLEQILVGEVIQLRRDLL